MKSNIRVYIIKVEVIFLLIFEENELLLSLIIYNNPQIIMDTFLRRKNVS